MQKVLQCDRPSSGRVQWKCVAVSGQDNNTSSTSVYIDYAKCILVPEKFGAYVVVANTGGLVDVSRTQEIIQANTQKSGDSQERMHSQERFTSAERFVPQASQESNATSGKCPEEVTNGEGR